MQTSAMGNDYLRFSRKERSGIMLLILLAVVAAVAAPYGKARITDKRVQDLAVSITDPGFSGAGPGPRREKPAYREQAPAIENTRYTARPGYAGEPQYPERQAGSERPAYSERRAFSQKSAYAGKPAQPRPAYIRKRPAVVDINAADTAVFIALPGIGPVLAARIVLFREKLGGFHSVGQIGEVYGLPDSVFRRLQPWLRCDSAVVRKIPLNTAEKDRLAAHPYIGWGEAKAIINYRRQHGPFRSLAALNRIVALDTAVLEKIRPYLSVE